MTVLTATTSHLLDPTAASRFWDNVRIGPADADACWPWITDVGRREPTGHIRIWHQGIRVYAHRLAFMLAGNVIEDQQVVRHICDVPSCMNSESHLLVGSIADNVADREARGRRTPFLPRGGAHWSAKLTDADALRIRTARQLGLPAHHLAAMYGVSRSTVYAIWSGVHYPCEPLTGPHRDPQADQLVA